MAKISLKIIEGNEKMMLNYSVREEGTFVVIGQQIELTERQNSNLQLSMQFWKQFNSNLKKASLSQNGNWNKYAFMYRKEGKLFYYCSIPKRSVVPDGFIEHQVGAHKYLVVEHVGAMNRIYSTYNAIYHDLLPECGYTHEQDEYLHYEKYDYRFHWNREDSLIEIWVPIK